MERDNIDNKTKCKNPFFERMKDFYNNNKDTFYNFTITVLAMFLVFYIFVGCKTYINSDSAFVVDFAQEQIRTKQFLPTNWVYGNEFWMFSLIPIISPLLLIGMKVFAARQFAVVIQSVLLILLTQRLFKKDISYKEGGNIILPLLLSGVSGMFAFEVFGDALYGSVIFFMLILLTLFLKMVNNNSKHLSILFGVIFVLLSTCNFGFSLFVGVPLLCVLCCSAFKNKEAVKDYIKIGIIILVSALIGFCGHKVLETTLIYKTEYYENSIVENDNSISQNISTLIYDYLSLCGSTDINTKGLNIYGYNTDSVFSMPIVLLIAVRYIFAITTLLIPLLLLRYLKVMNTSERTICLFTVFLAISVLLFNIFGNIYSWAQFAVSVLFFLLLLYPIAYKYIFSKENKRIIAFKCFVIACVFSSLFFVSISFFENSYLNVEIADGIEFASDNKVANQDVIKEVKELIRGAKLRKNPYLEIVGYLTKQGYSFGYSAFSLEHNIYNTLSNGKLRVIPLNSKMTGPGEWHNSLDWYNTDFYNGKVFLIRKKDQKKPEVEKSATKIITYGDYKVSFYKSNEEFLSYLEELKKDVKK